jgi:DNA-binding response OmpR family regulator
MPEPNAKILIVYGDEDVRTSLTTLLEREGFRTFEASNGGLAIDVIRTVTPDLMLLEIKKADLDGIDLIREAKGINPNLLILAVTAFRDNHGATRALKAGACGCLEKPVPIREVSRVVRQALFKRIAVAG